MNKRVQGGSAAEKSRRAESEIDIGKWGYALIAVSLGIIIFLPQFSVPWMLVVAFIAEFNEDDDDDDSEGSEWTSSLAMMGYSLLMFAASYAVWKWLEIDPGSFASYLYPDESSTLPSRLVLLAWLVLFMGSIRFLRATNSILRSKE